MDDNVAQTDFGSELRTSQAQGESTHNFTEQVARYFGSYISGALSADGLPLRVYGDTYDAGLIRKLPLDRYPQLQKNIYKNFVTGLSQQTFVISQNKYTTHHDEHILHVIGRNVAAVNKKELAPLVQALAAQAEATLVAPTADSTDTVTRLIETAKPLIARHFVVPYVLPLEDVDITGDEKLRELFAQLEESATSRIFDASREFLRHIYTAYFASSTYVSGGSLIVTLEDTFTPKLVKDSLEQYVEHLHINDAYQHVSILHRGVTVRDKLAMYLYFGELQYDGYSFPLFYTKMTSKHLLPSLTLHFENRIFINKQAIEYVIRHFAAQTNNPQISTSSITIPDVIYADDETAVLQHLLSDLGTLLGLESEIKLDRAAAQTITNQFVTLTNKTFFCLDQTSGGAIADDYADILANGELYENTEKFLSELLVKPTTHFIEEVSESWDEKSHFEKLLPTIPMQVNDEQKQVLLALSKTACERVVVDAADSTGKKHLIEASVFTALSKGNSVLVLTNSPQAATRLSTAIGSTLQKTSGTKGHNPVLNLHDTEILENLDDQLVSDVSASVELVEGKLSELAVAKKRKKQALKEGLAQFIQSAENINLHEVEQTVANEKRFAGRNWIEFEPIDAIGTSIQKLHRAIGYVRSSDAGYLMPYIEVNQQQAIEDFIGAFKEYEKANKNVNTRLPEFIVRYRKLLPEQRQHLQDSLAYIQSNYRQFVKILKDQPASSWLAITDNSTFRDVAAQETVLAKVLDIAQSASKYLRNSDDQLLLNELDGYSATPVEIIEALDTYIEQIATLKSKLFGFSGRMLVVENLNKQLMKSLPSFKLPDPEKQAENMQAMSEFVRYATEELAAAGLSTKHWKDIVHILLAEDGRVEEIEQIIESLNQTARFEFALDYKIYESDNLLANITLLDYATELNRVYREFPKLGKLFGITAINHLLARPHEFSVRINKLSRDLNEAGQLDDAKDAIRSFIQEYPDASKRLGIAYTANNLEITDDAFASSSSEYIEEYIAHKKKEQNVRAYFDEIATDSFGDTSIEYQQILGVDLQHTLNKNFLDLTAEQGDFLHAISDAFKQRRKLSSEETAVLLHAFPIITSEAHRLSSTLPLHSKLFDLVIIDAADSLTIAESLPAILRAKKLLIIGDSAQSHISDVPAVNSATDALYTRQLISALRASLSKEPADTKNRIINRLEGSFAANRPTLQFFADYANYTASLKKQYGAYEEITSLGEKYYYDNSLVSLMSRAVPLSDLFTFARITPSKDQVTRFTNSAEVEHIIEQLHTMKEQGYSGTISIVTPFAEQAALLQREIDESVITDWFARRKLVVTTFDDKRQHTSDYTFYSLVASSEFNELSQKLPSKIGFSAFEGDTRSQRLLSGMGGTMASMYFVHSLPLEGYGGSMSEALQHYATKLQGPAVKVKGAATDILLPTEANINQAFEKTAFARKYKDRVAFIAKYPFVNYIKPLSPTYHKASYKVFFLLMIDDRPIVIEFDDFKERFLQNSKSDKDNGGIYLTANDIYGYMLLEGYNYRFLRLNKFNIGSDPTQTLDTYLNELMKQPSWPADNGFVA